MSAGRRGHRGGLGGFVVGFRVGTFGTRIAFAAAGLLMVASVGLLWSNRFIFGSGAG